MSDPSPRVTFARRIAQTDAPLALYGILDAETCARRSLKLVAVAKAWCDAGIRLVQYRDKSGSDDDVLRMAESIAGAFADSGATLLLNDRVHLVAKCGWHGAHIGQGDMGPRQARWVLGEDAVLGISTHTLPQVEVAAQTDVDYIALGPIFATSTKADAEPIVGLCTLEAACAFTRLPLVAIGGITAGSARRVRKAGADCVAVISALLPSDHSDVSDETRIAQTARDFLLSVQ